MANDYSYDEGCGRPMLFRGVVGESNSDTTSPLGHTQLLQNY